MTAKGKRGDKVQAKVLWDRRRALWWWIVRIIPDFGSIYLQWDVQTSAHIHPKAIDLGLSTMHYQDVIYIVQ